jgi:AcrR family transcriptional regulator
MGSQLENTRNGRAHRSETRKREILDAAREVFTKSGYERASMAEIAAKVGVVEGALYKHFGSKRELLFESTRAFYEPLIEATARELQAVHGTRNRLRFVIGRQLAAFAGHPALCRLIMHEIRPHEDYHGSVVRELNRKSTSAVVSILEEGKRSGELRAEVKPALIRDVIFGGIEHLAWRALSGRGAIDVEGQADALADLIWSGAAGVQAPAASDAERELSRLRAQVDRLEELVGALARGGARGRTRVRKP